MKVIFLDVDGVLNCDSTEESFLDSGVKYNGIDMGLLTKFHRLITETDCVIVLSSTWRLFTSFENHLKERMDALQSGLSEKIIGKTSFIARYVGDQYGSRSEEIDDWLVTSKVVNFVILDDTDLGLSYKFPENFVKVDSRVGLSDKNVDDAIFILNKLRCE